LDRNVVLVGREKSHAWRPRGAEGARRKVLSGRLVVFVVGGGYGFQVFGFENLIAIEASYIVHTVAPSHDFRASVIAGLHKKGDYPHSKHAGLVVKPLKVPVSPLFALFFPPMGWRWRPPAFENQPSWGASTPDAWHKIAI
jgi:hypothetical protein